MKETSTTLEHREALITKDIIANSRLCLNKSSIATMLLKKKDKNNQN